MRSAIWVAILRPHDEGDIAIGPVMTLRELVSDRVLELRMRYNPEMRLLTMRLPPGTTREQTMEALEVHLTRDERIGLYNLPQHALTDRT